jgi:aromatic ring-opening dioxygenase catalytic subunit (LigB family)
MNLATGCKDNIMIDAFPTLYIPHGGGPCFFMDWTMGPADSWNRLEHWLRHCAADLPAEPKAILVVSAHWEESAFTVQSGSAPGLLFDYYGFPEHTYRLEYPAPGAPAFAARARDLLESSGCQCREDFNRPFDHGVFVPLMLMFPNADIPVFQVSLRAELDPVAHLRAGLALAPLRREGVLIVGSGMSYHNLRNFIGAADTGSSATFDDWLLGLTELEPGERFEKLSGWLKAPCARLAHPREEHLLPLMMAAGAGVDSPMRRVFRDEIHGHAVSAFQFG